MSELNQIKRQSHKKTMALFKNIKSYKTIYKKWHDMVSRCYNPKNCNYKYYGARGIKVCEEWLGEEGLYNFSKWILSIGYDENKNGRCQSLDKINNDGNYEPNNCRLATPSIQNSNIRIKAQTGYKGVSLHTSGTCYTASLKFEGVRYFVGQSKSKNQCAKMINDFILKNNLQKPLNIIKSELENILPTKINTFKCYDKNHLLLYEERYINDLADKIKLSKFFIEQCLSGKRNSKLYTFEKEEKIVYEY